MPIKTFVANKNIYKKMRSFDRILLIVPSCPDTPQRI